MAPEPFLRMTRRGALAAAAGWSGSLRAAGSGYAPRLAAQTYVWLQDFQSRKLSVAEGIEEAFPAMRRAGFRDVELMPAYLEAKLRERTLRLLKENGLRAPIVYAGGVMHERESAGKTIASALGFLEAAKPAGARLLNFNPNPKPNRERKTDAELEVQARALDELGKALRRRGSRLMLHQHDAEMREEAREWRHWLRSTDPKAVEFCADTDWMRRGGQDPMALLREAGGRMGMLHVRNSRQGVWLESFGDGDVDYRKVAAYLRELKFAGYIVVELAYEKGTSVTRPLEEDLRLSRSYAEQVFGAGRL